MGQPHPNGMGGNNGDKKDDNKVNCLILGLQSDQQLLNAFGRYHGKLTILIWFLELDILLAFLLIDLRAKFYYTVHNRRRSRNTNPQSLLESERRKKYKRDRMLRISYLQLLHMLNVGCGY